MADKTLTYDELEAYIKEHGITLIKTTMSLREIPSGTELYMGHDDEAVSSFNMDTEYKNKGFDYDFDYEWSVKWNKVYTGKFILAGVKSDVKLHKELVVNYSVEELVLAVKTIKEREDAKVKLVEQIKIRDEATKEIKELRKVLK